MRFIVVATKNIKNEIIKAERATEKKFNTWIDDKIDVKGMITTDIKLPADKKTEKKETDTETIWFTKALVLRSNPKQTKLYIHDFLAQDPQFKALTLGASVFGAELNPNVKKFFVNQLKRIPGVIKIYENPRVDPFKVKAGTIALLTKDKILDWIVVDTKRKPKPKPKPKPNETTTVAEEHAGKTGGTQPIKTALPINPIWLVVGGAAVLILILLLRR